jgi:hypothetical protein
MSAQRRILEGITLLLHKPKCIIATIAETTTQELVDKHMTEVTYYWHKSHAGD